MGPFLENLERFVGSICRRLPEDQYDFCRVLKAVEGVGGVVDLVIMY